jgi:ribosomal protein S18 acetylase RimI-like enzyme
VVVIRECTAGDLHLLEQRMPTGGHDAHAHHFAQQQAGTRTYLIAWQETLPVGCCLILWDGCAAAEVRTLLREAVEISSVHVRPDARGRGIGTALIHDAEQRITARGRTFITIGVSVDNPRAAALYSRLGYCDTGLRSVARYTYRDDGSDRDVTERNITLAKSIDIRPRIDNGPSNCCG